MSSVPARFKGKDGKARLLKALRAQKLVSDDEVIAEKLLAVATPETYYPRKNASDIMTEGEFTSDIYFILSGEVAIRIKGIQVNVRVPGDHVGRNGSDPRGSSPERDSHRLGENRSGTCFRIRLYRDRERAPRDVAAPMR